MDEIEKIIIKIRNTTNPQEINNILIELSKKPNIKLLAIIDYLLDSLPITMLEKVKMNLIFLLGGIGKISILNQKYLNFLIENYYNSDRWVRNEIIQAFLQILHYHEYNNEILEILKYALNEDYTPIKKGALNALLLFKGQPKIELKILLKVLDTDNSEIVEKGIIILKKYIQNRNDLFGLLNTSKNYTILSKSIIRILIITYFDSKDELESFKENINSSEWEDKYKVLCNTEITSFQNIFMKKG